MGTISSVMGELPGAYTAIDAVKTKAALTPVVDRSVDQIDGSQSGLLL